MAADETAAMRLTDAGETPGDSNLLRITHETIALSPGRLLVTAADAIDLTLEEPVILQSVLQDVVRFTLDGAPVRIYLNRHTHLPTAMDYEGPLARGGYWNYLGDVRMRTWFGFWWLTAKGIRMPLQRDVTRNGLPDTTTVISDLTLDGPVRQEELAISEAIRGRFTDAGAPVMDLGRAAIDLARGITLIEGSWNVSVVEQPDGIMLIEAPISSAYSVRVLEWVARRYPGRKIKAVVTTSDSWPHVAGVREYVARGISIYCLDLNIPQITRFMTNPHNHPQDALESARRRPVIRPVSRMVALGTGPNRIEIHPIRGETSERQLMVYFPARQLLYGSDPFQKAPDGTYFHPQTVDELVAAVARERLAPTRFYMMHMGPAPWSAIGSP